MNTDDNYYDISIMAKRKPNNLSTPNLSSSNLHIRTRRSSNPTTTTTTSAAADFKRPGDYYIQKLTNSSVSLQGKRPISGDSIISLNSTYSDEISLNSENHDSRLSSLTSNSITSPNESPQINNFKLEDSIHSLSTIIDKSQQLINPRKFPISNMTKSSTKPSTQSPGLGVVTDKSASTTTLNRCKTKFFSQMEIKQRQQLRKKQYDDSCNEDEILSNDIDLVFNVPVVKNQTELFFKKNLSTSIDDKYKPFPLPGKLRSNSTPNFKPDGGVESVVTADSSIIEENEDGNSLEDSIDDDSQIASNLSAYYTERSKSYSKLVKISRKEDMLYKLPNYIKSHLSIEDLDLISPEKLGIINSTRPINLPPKLDTDIIKHNREVQKIYRDFEHVEINTKDDDDYKQDWINLLETPVMNKHVMRKLNWNSNCPEPQRFEYLTGILSNPDLDRTIHDNFNKLFEVYDHLNETIRTSRRQEFTALYDKITAKPLFRCLHDSNQREEFIHLMFLKSLDNSLRRHDEIFLIPVVLLTFEDIRLESKFKLIELLNMQIFTKEFVSELNRDLGLWLTKLPKRLRPLLESISAKEFVNLNLIRFFEVFGQLNDKLPLSLSASNPSTPILNKNISCSKELGYKFLQLVTVYSISQARIVNMTKLIESFLVVLLKYYHINWLDFGDLLKSNKSIKLNFNMNSVIDLNNFNDKWWNMFKKV